MIRGEANLNFAVPVRQLRPVGLRQIGIVTFIATITQVNFCGMTPLCGIVTCFVN